MVEYNLNHLNVLFTCHKSTVITYVAQSYIAQCLFKSSGVNSYYSASNDKNILY